MHRLTLERPIEAAGAPSQLLAAFSSDYSEGGKAIPPAGGGVRKAGNGACCGAGLQCGMVYTVD